MEKNYLFVHFREKNTVDGEQVYFALSRNGFHWEMVNNGKPVLESTMGDCNVRDCVIYRLKNRKFIILATDAGLARHFNGKYKSSWAEISRNGNKEMAFWESSDLVHWNTQRMIKLGDENFGCMWAPDIIYDSKNCDYIIHWSSSHSSYNYSRKKIYFCRTKDFLSFTKPDVLYEKDDASVIDSAMYEENGIFYFFVKSDGNPAMVIMLKSDNITGPFSRISAFDSEMAKLEQGQYEAPAAVKTEDGRWLLFLDFYGTVKEKQGYIPFVSDNIAEGTFVRSDRDFSFPYGFKHGTILTITPDEYIRIRDAYPQ